MISKACEEHIEMGRELWKEANELNMIFTTIIKKSKEKI